MATPSELTSDGLLLAYYGNIKQQRELRARQKELEIELEKRYGLLSDKFKRGEIDIKEGTDGEHTVAESV
jgi:hypothetical protein